MKDINGNDLQQPYYDLAVMRREQKPDKRYESGFAYGESPEGVHWWVSVVCLENPPIPVTSLAELEAWRKLKDISPVEDISPKDGQTIYAINPCKMEGSGQNALTVGHPYTYIGGSIYYFNVIDDMGDNHSFEKKEFDKYFSVTQPADTTNWIDPLNVKRVSDTDWKAMYQVIIDKYNELDKRYLDLLEIQQKEAKQRVTAEPSKFIAECAMMLIAKKTFNAFEDVNLVWDCAEAMAAEGKNRGHLPNN